MKNIIKNTRDIQIGSNKIFLRVPMDTLVQNKLGKVIENRNHILRAMKTGNIPAILHLILLNQMVIWGKLREK